MSDSTQSRPKSFKLYYFFATAAVALTALLTVAATLSPAVILPPGMDTGVAIFLVPVVLLIVALLAEAVHAAWGGGAPLSNSPPLQRITQWEPGRNEG